MVRLLLRAAATTPPAPPTSPGLPEQDKLAAEIARNVRTAGPLPRSASALANAIRKAQYALKADGVRQADALATAGLLARARLTEQRVWAETGGKAPRGAVATTLMVHELVGVAGTGRLNAVEKTRVEQMLLSSAYAHRLGSGVQFAGQALQAAETSQLSASAKSRLEHAILGSRVARSLPAPARKFLAGFRDALARVRRNPKDATARETVTVDARYIHPARPMRPAGPAALDNLVGTTLGLKPNRAPVGAAAPAGTSGSGTEGYTGEELKAVRAIAGKIRRVGGADAAVSAQPVYFVPHGKHQAVRHTVWRVSARQGPVRYVSDEGRIYKSRAAFIKDNQYGFGRLSMAQVDAGGRAVLGADGRVRMLTHEHKKGWMDYAKQIEGDVAGGLMLAGGVVLAGAAIIGSGGTATPLVVMASVALFSGGAFYALRGEHDLGDRYQHGQSIAPDQAGGDYMDIALGVLPGAAEVVGPGVAATEGVRAARGGSRAVIGTRTAASRVLTVGASAANAGELASSTKQTVRHWGALSTWDQVNYLLNAAMFAAGAGAHGARAYKGFREGRRRGPCPPRAPIERSAALPGEQMHDTVPRPAAATPGNPDRALALQMLQPVTAGLPPEIANRLADAMVNPPASGDPAKVPGWDLAATATSDPSQILRDRPRRTDFSGIRATMARLSDPRWEGSPSDKPETYLDFLVRCIEGPMRSEFDGLIEPVLPDGSYIQTHEYTDRTSGQPRSKTGFNLVVRIRGSKRTGRAVVVVAHGDGLTTDQKVQLGMDPTEYRKANDNSSAVAGLLQLLRLIKWFEEVTGQVPIDDDLIAAVVSPEEINRHMVGTRALLESGAVEKLGLRPVAFVALEMLAVRASGDPGLVVNAGPTPEAAERLPWYRTLTTAARALGWHMEGSHETPEGRMEGNHHERTDDAAAGRYGVPDRVSVGHIGKVNDPEYHGTGDTWDRPEFDCWRIAAYAESLVVALAMRGATPLAEPPAVFSMEADAGRLAELGDRHAAAEARKRHASALEDVIDKALSAPNPDSSRLIHIYGALSGTRRVQMELLGADSLEGRRAADQATAALLAMARLVGDHGPRDPGLGRDMYITVARLAERTANDPRRIANAYIAAGERYRDYANRAEGSAAWFDYAEVCPDILAKLGSQGGVRGSGERRQIKWFAEDGLEALRKRTLQCVPKTLGAWTPFTGQLVRWNLAVSVSLRERLRELIPQLGSSDTAESLRRIVDELVWLEANSKALLDDDSRPAAMRRIVDRLGHRS